jgi:hypothetical protein
MPDLELPLTDGYSPARIEERIRRFESLGVHRTGWPADDQTSKWLVEELGTAGVPAEIDRFQFPRVEFRGAAITIAGERIEGVPLYDAGFTDYGGIDGELCEDTDSDIFGKIVIATSAERGVPEWSGFAISERIDELSEQGAVGLVIPHGDRDGQIVLRNAHRIEKPHALPVLQVAPRETRSLKAALVIGGEGVLEADGERLNSNAQNVVATIEGADPEAAPIGIVTPKSGWYTCAAERGGGIAVFLALAESLAAMGTPPRTIHLLASSGHELDFAGIRAYARVHRANIAGAAGWLHLGASIGAREEPRPVTATSDDELHSLTAAAVANAGVEPALVREPGPSQGGEALIISELDTRYVSFLGGHAYFHSPSDTVDQAFDAEHVARWAGASREVVAGLLAL